VTVTPPRHTFFMISNARHLLSFGFHMTTGVPPVKSAPPVYRKGWRADWRLDTDLWI